MVINDKKELTKVFAGHVRPLVASSHNVAAAELSPRAAIQAITIYFILWNRRVKFLYKRTLSFKTM